MSRAKIGGREYKMAFTLAAMDDIGERFGIDSLIGGEDINRIMSKPGDMLSLFCILAKHGEEIEIDEKELKKAIRPGQIPAMCDAILSAIEEGMRMETESAEDDEPVDVVLEELKKKEARGG